MRISLRAGERIYINGAVLRAERKLTFELLNNASFLLENHIIQAEEATTPLRQLYFALADHADRAGKRDRARRLRSHLRRYPLVLLHHRRGGRPQAGGTAG